MKLLLRYYLPGCLLILFSGAVFSQDTARKLLSPSPLDTTAPASGTSHDTAQRSKDSIPVASKDSSVLKPGIAPVDSTHIAREDSMNIKTGDSIVHRVRKTVAMAGSAAYSGNRRNGSGRLDSPETLCLKDRS